MPKLADKKTELQTLERQMRSIEDVYHDDLPPPEKYAEYKRMTSRWTELGTEITELEHWEAQRVESDKIKSFMDQKEYRMPRGNDVANGGSEAKSALLAAGWEVKQGIIHAPTSVGKMVPMYPEDVLFGTIPDEDADTREFYVKTRAIFQPDYTRIYGKYMRLVIKTHDVGIAWTQMEPFEQKALSEGTDTAGGLLVPPDIQAEMLVRLPMQAVVRGAGTRVVTTSRDMIRFPRLQPNANATNASIYSSGFVGDWAPETPVFADVDPKLGVFQVDVKKIRVATKVSNDLVADSVLNFLAFLSTEGARNMALVEDQGFIAGIGDALHPLGLLAAAAGITQVDVGGTTTHTISNTLAALGSAKGIMNVQANVPSQYQADAQWLMHRLTENDVRQLTDGVGRFIWAPGFAERQDELLGKKINRSDFMPKDSDAVADANVLIYGDFSSFIIAQRAQITTTILRERFADSDQTGIILWERVGGGIWNSDAFRIGYAHT